MTDETETLNDELSELCRAMPDVPLDELTIDQLRELQTAAENLSAWVEQRLDTTDKQ